MTDRIAQASKTIKDALERPPTQLPLRRHRDDNYWDEVTVLADDVVLHGGVVPRFKTSGLSGNEWRTRAQLVVGVFGESVVDRSFRDLNTLLTHAPGFIYADRGLRSKLDSVPERGVSLIVKRKSITLFESDDFRTFGDAVMGMFWSLVVASEQSSVWHNLTNDEELARCQQVGCAERPVNTYRLKKLMEGQDRRCFLEPAYDFVGQYVWYCARHTLRGDCGFEDADSNLELVSGNGVARAREEDESPSVLGGVVEVKLP